MSHGSEGHTSRKFSSLFPATEAPMSPFYAMLQSAPPDYLLQREEPREYPPAFPVYYFFYGTLTKPTQLQRIIDLEDEPKLRRAEVIGYDIAKWGDYPALVNGKQGQVVSGYAYLVMSEEEARKLAEYETRAYKVAPCWIFFQDGEEPREEGGKVFMYAGDAQALLEGRFDRVLWERQMGGRLG
ncbi:hypothetical protein BDV38DRAFT_249301 [Aspergillus pseudotamarii]|uniref:Putative gamma-glutamylcyclotransferase n=1 Tax=Aspergillus pseudotamarii TaxID=132259 RepID=A0A5N6SPG6_ASPPS|nr:uncharacterized protein BDV38DRAFT_249301 [Aspergillus pseudotamarii]KAE8136588.1 hypothetical protein BDV38DRAFT_249301 [Aspergillus pseudotamarii]